MRSVFVVKDDTAKVVVQRLEVVAVWHTDNDLFGIGTDEFSGLAKSTIRRYNACGDALLTAFRQNVERLLFRRWECGFHIRLAE